MKVIFWAEAALLLFLALANAEDHHRIKVLELTIDRMAATTRIATCDHKVPVMQPGGTTTAVCQP